MAALPDPPLVSADEYLNSSYHPDMEYVDGVLEERSTPSIAHGVLQLLLGAWFHAYRRQFRFVMMSETEHRLSNAPGTGYPT